MDKTKLRVVFMGTPEIAAYVFEGMIRDGYHFVGLIAQPDKPVGRKKEIVPVPTKAVALKYGIPVFQPIKIRLDYAFAQELKPDIIITMAYGQIVPQGLLDIPRYGCLNLHGSLLPKYRGAAPMQYALINGEKETGITLMEMIDKMDAGRMYSKRIVALAEDETMTSLIEKFKPLALSLILSDLPLYIDGQLPGIPQDESQVTFASMIKADAEHLNITLPAEKFCGWVKALCDHPGGYLNFEEKKVKIFKAIVVNHDVNAPLGTLVNADRNGLILQVGDGQVRLLVLQKEGKGRVDAQSFINGHPNLLGKVMN